MTIRPAWHSTEPDGCEDGSGVRRPVYHVCANCPYLQAIVQRGNTTSGPGENRSECFTCIELEKAGQCIRPA